jgi:hypothetical protein
MDLNMDIVRQSTCGQSCDIEPMVASARQEMCRSDREGYGVDAFARAQGSEHPALSEVGVKMKRLIHKTVGWTGFCSPTTGFMLQADRKSDVRPRPVTSGERLQGRWTVRTDDELATVRRERDHRQARLRQAEAERDALRADIAEALDQVEYWRTLAEYRERRLTERQDGEDTERERRPDKNKRLT